MITTENPVFKTNELLQFAKSIFLSIGCSEKDASLAAEVLIQADLRGIDSHGLARLSGYVRLYEAGRINPKPNIKVIREKKSVFTIDGDGGLGLITAPYAMEMALEKTELYGSGFGSVSNSNHFGIAAYHAMKALEKGYIGMAMTNASPLVAPLYSKERMLGTNPVCFAIPAGKEDPFVLDMASSAAANGKLEIAERTGKPIPEGWLENAEGNASTDPGDLRKGGYLLPLGSDKDHGSHKGYGLGALVDILSGVLSGANFGPWVPPFVAFLPLMSDLPGKGIGHFLGAFDVDGFAEKVEFGRKMDIWIKRFRSAKPLDNSQPVIIPGQPEFAAHAYRTIHGIPLVEKVITDLKNLSIQYSVDHPF